MSESEIYHQDSDPLVSIPEQPVDAGQREQLKNTLEALLFMAEEPIPLERLSHLLSIDNDTLACLIDDLSAGYRNRGVRILHIAEGFKMGTAPECAEVVKNFLENPAQVTLSKAALEALAIVAYRQPITRGGIENIRGVNSDAVVAGLLEKGLLSEVGQSGDIGRPFLLGTTTEFLKYFGLVNLDALPEHPFAATQLPLQLDQQEP